MSSMSSMFDDEALMAKPAKKKSGKKNDEEKRRKEEKRKKREASEKKAVQGSLASIPDSPDSPAPSDDQPLILPKRGAKAGRRGSIGASGSSKVAEPDPLREAFASSNAAPAEKKPDAASTAASPLRWP